MGITGSNDLYYAAQPVVVMGPEHAKTVAAGGFSKTDAKRFQQVLFNLVNNAVKFTDRQGKIHLKVEQTDACKVRVTISDCTASFEGLPSEAVTSK